MSIGLKLVQEVTEGNEFKTIVKRCLGELITKLQKNPNLWMQHPFIRYMNERDVEQVIKTLDRIPTAEERAVILDQAFQLSTQSMDGWMRANIINFLANIPRAEERAIFTTHASRLTEDLDEDYYKHHVIQCLASIPEAEKRADIGAKTVQLKTQNTDGREIGDIIKGLLSLIGFWPSELRI